MKKIRKLFFWVLGVTGCIVALLLVLDFLLPRFINLESIKERIQTTVSQKVGVTVEFQSIDLSLFPSPHVKVHRAHLSFPGITEGSMDSLRVYPRILPLFKGEVHIAKVSIHSPDFTLNIPETAKKKKEPQESRSVQDLEKQITSVFASLALNVPNLVIVMEKGNLNISRRDEILFSLQDLHTRIVFPPKGPRIKIICTSNFCENISLKAQLDQEDLRGTVTIELNQIQPEALISYFVSPGHLRIAESMANIDLNLTIDGLNNIRAEAKGSLPYLTVYRGNKKAVLKAKKFDIALHKDGDKTTVSVEELNLENPELLLTGTLSIDQASPAVMLALEARDLDVKSGREAALALAGDVETIQDIFTYMRGGTVPLITFTGQGTSLDDLDDTGNFVIKGSLQDGEVYVPGPKLALAEVKGDAVIVKGILNATNCKASAGNSRGHEGTLKIGLEGEDAPFHLDINVDADLSELPSVLQRFVEKGTFVREISLIEDIEGTATGRLILGESTSSMNAKIAVSRFNLSANYNRIPYPLKIQGGHFFYDENEINVKDVSAQLIQSSFSGISVRFGLDKEAFLDVSFGKSKLFTSEMHSVLTSFSTIKENIKKLRHIKGVVSLSSASLKGPLHDSEKWLLTLAGDVKHLAVRTTVFPGPLEVRKGNFHAVHDETKQVFSFHDAHIEMLDASLLASGTLHDYLKGISKAEIRIQGNMRAESIKWISDFINLSPVLNLHSPLSVSQAHLVVDKSTEKISFNGKMAVKRGPALSIDVTLTPEELAIKDVLIEDKESRALISFTSKKEDLSFKFKGNLTAETINRLFIKSEFPTGWIKGDFQAHIIMDDPRTSSARGKLMGQDILFPYKLAVPLKIDGISLNATGKKIDLKSAVFSWGERQLLLEGDVRFSDEAFHLDMDLSADGVDWEPIGKSLKKQVKEKDDKKGKTLWDIPMRGSLRIRSEYFRYGQFTWSPFHANVSLVRDEVGIIITKADLCGISTPGDILITSEDIQLYFQPVAVNQELQPAFQCFLDKERVSTGKFNLSGDIKAQGTADELVGSLNGNVEFTANDGLIYGEKVLANTFAFLNVTEIFRGKLPDVGKEGFPYHSVIIKGDIKNGVLLLDKGVIDGSTMDIVGKGNIDFKDKEVDLKLFVSPLQTVDFIIEKIPGINQLMGGTLISIPVKVTGNIDNLKVSYFSPTEAETGILGIIKKTLNAPFKIIKPVLPAEEEKKKTE